MVTTKGWNEIWYKRFSSTFLACEWLQSSPKNTHIWKPKKLSKAHNSVKRAFFISEIKIDFQTTFWCSLGLIALGALAAISYWIKKCRYEKLDSNTISLHYVFHFSTSAKYCFNFPIKIWCCTKQNPFLFWVFRDIFHIKSRRFCHRLRIS